MALQAVEDFGPVPLVDLDELADDALIMPCGGIGAPTVSIEKIENGEEGARLREHVERLWGRPVVAFLSAEIGGSNGLIPIVWAARVGLPVVDADGMGRAFPEVPQVTMHVAGISPNPAVMTDDFDASLWAVAREGGEVCGVMLSTAGQFDMGFVNGLAVRPAWRRRGLGLALLRQAFTWFWSEASAASASASTARTRRMPCASTSGPGCAPCGRPTSTRRCCAE